MTRSITPRTTGEAEREIRARLEELQDAGGAARVPTTNEAPGIVVTKDGQMVPPGAPIPTDAAGNPVPTTLVPAAEFHGEEE